jgi:hypothetical protein
MYMYVGDLNMYIYMYMYTPLCYLGYTRVYKM